MSKTSRKKRRQSREPCPWGKRKTETSMGAFRRKATPLMLKDQARLVELGWKPLEAAIEAWETMTTKV